MSKRYLVTQCQRGRDLISARRHAEYLLLQPRRLCSRDEYGSPDSVVGVSDISALGRVPSTVSYPPSGIVAPARSTSGRVCASEVTGYRCCSGYLPSRGPVTG